MLLFGKNSSVYLPSLECKDVFSIDRALRIDWIEYVLKNAKAELNLGDREKKI